MTSCSSSSTFDPNPTPTKQRKLNDGRKDSSSNSNTNNADTDTDNAFDVLTELRNNCMAIGLSSTNKSSPDPSHCTSSSSSSLLLETTTTDMHADVWIDASAIKLEVENNSSQYQNSTVNDYNWAAEEFHYFNEENTELTLKYILVLDCLNFCFWPLPNYHYMHLAHGLKHVLQQNSKAFDAQNLANIDKHTLNEWLLCKFDVNTNANADNTNTNINTNTSTHNNEDEDVIAPPPTPTASKLEVPLLCERVRLLNECGRVLLSLAAARSQSPHNTDDDNNHAGSVTQLVLSANGSASTLVSTICAQFRGFADHCIYPRNGTQIAFYKRAQIFVSDVFCAFKGKDIGAFSDIHQLTCFADYRVPQILHELNILRYSDKLKDMIYNGTEINAGSMEEILIRVHTINATEQLKQELLKTGNIKLLSIELDWNLWNRGEVLNLQQKLKPHHRTRTIYY